MNTTKLITLATSPTLEGINKLVNQYFFTNIELRPSPNILTGNKSEFLDLFNSKGQLNNFTVIKGNRYKFLMKY
jgi:hypothetical protein